VTNLTTAKALKLTIPDKMLTLADTCSNKAPDFRFWHFASFRCAPVADMAAFETFAATQAPEPNTGLVPVPSAFMSGNVSEIAAMMARYRLPATHYTRAYAEAGGLLSYGNDVADNYRRSATFVDKILKGAKPSDLPIQFPVKFELVINRKTARALGLEIPPTLLATADELIN